MEFSATATSLEDIVRWREMYRAEMNCQIIHDSIHGRPGWTKEFLLSVDGSGVGYGSVAVAGPWKDAPTAYEVYVVPNQRAHSFELFQALLDAGGAVGIEIQSNDPLAAAMLHTFAPEVTSESILFHDKVSTSLRVPGARFREATAGEFPDVRPEQLKWHGVVEMDGRVVATGGILFHYNPPYGDIFMDVPEGWRRRGLGSFLVQELKRVCYAGGRIPSARCRTENVASRKTLLKAGYVPCGHILKGLVRPKAGPG